MQQLQAILGCQLVDFSITYLGLPLSMKKVPKTKIQSKVDAVARRMPTCHGPLMNRSGRLIWIKSVLCAIPIYTIITDDLPPWAIEEINAIFRRFLWTGKEGSIRGKYMVAWLTICWPKELGGLGISDLASPPSPCRQDGSSCSKPTRATPRLSCHYRCPAMSTTSSRRPHTQSLGTVAPSPSGWDGGSRAKQSSTLHHVCSTS